MREKFQKKLVRISIDQDHPSTFTLVDSGPYPTFDLSMPQKKKVAFNPSLSEHKWLIDGSWKVKVVIKRVETQKSYLRDLGKLRSVSYSARAKVGNETNVKVLRLTCGDPPPQGYVLRYDKLAREQIKKMHSEVAKLLEANLSLSSFGGTCIVLVCRCV